MRFLIHVQGNPLPEIHKTTTTPTILKGEDIEWTVDITNNDEKLNPHKYTSNFFVVDALPWNKDGRYDTFWNQYHGSRFSGTLKYKTLSIDFSKDKSAKDSIKVYTTTDTNARTDEREKILGCNWTELKGTVSGTKITYNMPASAIAVKVDATLPFNENKAGGIQLKMTANVTNPAQQQIDDTYINQAHVMNGLFMKESESVRTQVLSVFIHKAARIPPLLKWWDE